jgi:NAD(P)-dependent dehydrogenase (short-subunit alcohol dehydrogenase family)
LRSVSRSYDAELRIPDVRHYKQAAHRMGNRSQEAGVKQNTNILSGAAAVVTGASRGIGLAIATRLAWLGAQVILTGRDEGRLEAARHSIAQAGGKCEAVACDLADLASVEQLGAYVRRAYRRIDVLVNNAGVAGPAGPAHELAAGDWDAVMHTNLRGVFYMARAFVPLLIETGGGHIINISSLAGKNPLPRGAAYSASKWGLNGFTYSIAEELREHNIRASVICPGSVDTDFSGRSAKDGGKKLRPEDVAHAVEMLVTQRPGSFISDISLRPTLKP